MPRQTSRPNPKFEEGIHLFNAQRFFEAHEALEGVWLKAQGAEKTFLHGLIQVAAAFHHRTRGNMAGLRSLLEKGADKLAGLGKTRGGVDLAHCRRQLNRWLEYLQDESGLHPGTPPPIPHIKYRQRK